MKSRVRGRHERSGVEVQNENGRNPASFAIQHLHLNVGFLMFFRIRIVSSFVFLLVFFFFFKDSAGGYAFNASLLLFGRSLVCLLNKSSNLNQTLCYGIFLVVAGSQL
jgi:membrane-associated HD superfamily phosphohydrolase